MFNLFGSGHQTVSTFNKKLNKKVFVRCIYLSSLYRFFLFKNYYRNLADIGLNFTLH